MTIRPAATKALRWAALVPAAIIGWHAAFLGGLMLLDAAKHLCPAESLVSGFCVAPWFRHLETAITCASVAVAAFLVVVLPTWVAPVRKMAVAGVAFAAGLAVAIIFAVQLSAWAEFASAVLGGAVGLALALRAAGRAAPARPADLR